MRNFGIKSTFQSRPRPTSDDGGGKLNFVKSLIKEREKHE
jgi:hypothetical protein